MQHQQQDAVALQLLRCGRTDAQCSDPGAHLGKRFFACRDKQCSGRGLKIWAVEWTKERPASKAPPSSLGSDGEGGQSRKRARDEDEDEENEEEACSPKANGTPASTGQELGSGPSTPVTPITTHAEQVEAALTQSLVRTCSPSPGGGGPASTAHSRVPGGGRGVVVQAPSSSPRVPEIKPDPDAGGEEHVTGGVTGR